MNEVPFDLIKYSELDIEQPKKILGKGQKPTEMSGSFETNLIFFTELLELFIKENINEKKLQLKKLMEI